MRTFLLTMLAVAVMENLALAQGIPLTLNYQGRVDVNGIPFDGNGQFKFAITNQAADTYYWTNDNSEPDPPAAPTASVSITVKGGLYSVNLGDTSLTNMTAVPTSVFDTPGVFLRVWFDDGTNGEQLLAPDKQLTSVPFAYKAEKVGPESITGENLARESVWPEHEGRSNTVVSKYGTAGNMNDGDTIDIGDPVPAGETFVVTDMVFSANDERNLQVFLLYDDGGVETILYAFHYVSQWSGADTNNYSDYRPPYSLSFRAGFPVPEGAQIRMRIADKSLGNIHMAISGYEFAN